MRIHNYYSDILSRLYMFLNDSVFSHDNKIKRIQYNLGSASSIVQYQDHYDLPSAVIKLGEIAPWASAPTNPALYQMNNRHGFSPYRLVAVSNQTKGIDLELQSQYMSIQVEVSINCESQMQALNLAHDITLRMPVDRLMNQFNFISFIELDDRYMSPTIMDIQNDEIFNLFLNYDSVDSRPSYTFSFEFQPLIRLTGPPQQNLDDSTKASYQVMCSFEINTQVPFHIISPQLPVVDTESNNARLNTLKPDRIGRLTSQMSTLPVYSNVIYYTVIAGALTETVSIDRSNIDSANHLQYNSALTDGRSYSISADYIGDDTKFNYEVMYKGSLLSGSGVLFQYVNSVSVCRLTGDIVGNILDPVVSKTHNSISAISGIVLGNAEKLLIDNEQITFDVSWSRVRPVMMNTRITPGWIIKQPALNDLYSVVTNVNAYRTTLNPADTKIYKFDIIDTSTNVQTATTLTTPVSLLPDGSFGIDITSPVAMTVSGQFNKSTGMLMSSTTTSANHEILTIDLNPVWDYLPYGSNQFDSVSLDIGGVSRSAIPSSQSHDAFINTVSNLDTNYVSVYSTLPYTQINTQFTFTLTLDPKVVTINPALLNKQFEVYFVHDGRYFSSTRTSDFMLDLLKSIPTELVFNVTENFRLNVLDRVSKYLPIYFGIILL